MKIAYVVYPDFTALDLVGPYEVISRWPDAARQVASPSWRSRVRLSSTVASAGGGRSLAYSTYLGGAENERVNSLAITRNGEVVITGRTDSPDFPVANAGQATLSGDIDAFVSKLRCASFGRRRSLAPRRPPTIQRRSRPQRLPICTTER